MKTFLHNAGIMSRRKLKSAWNFFFLLFLLFFFLFFLQVVSSAAVSLVDAADAIQSYTILLKKALDDSNPERKSAWEEAVGLSLEKDRLLSAATAGYGEAKSALLIALQAIEGGRQNPKTR